MLDTKIDGYEERIVGPCPKQHKKPLSLQAALSVVIADLSAAPVAITAEGEMLEQSDCSSASVSSSHGDDGDDDENETRGYTEETEAGGNIIKRPKAHRDDKTKLLARAQQSNPFAPIAADGSLLLVAPSVPLLHPIGKVSSAALRVPNPLLLQVLPPRLCASAVSIFAHKGEKIFRLVVLREGLNISEDDAAEHVPDNDPRRAAPPPSSSGTSVLRHMYQVGQHYNLFPLLYCSCSAFKYLCLAPNSAPATMTLVIDEEGNNNNKGATSTDRPLRESGIFGGASTLQSSNNTSNSLYCKHLAAVAMALSNSPKDEIRSEARSSCGPLRSAERGSGDQFTLNDELVDAREGERLRVSSNGTAALLELEAAKFPRDKLVNVKNPCANNVTQKVDRLLFEPNGGGVTGKGVLGGDKTGIGRRSSGMGFEALDPVARHNLLPQLVTAANANTTNRTAEEGGERSNPPLGVSHNRHRRVMGSLIEDKLISADEFSRIWGSELFK